MKHWTLTTEKVVNDWVSSTVSIHKPVGKREPSIDSLSVFGMCEHPKHSVAEKQKQNQEGSLNN